MYFNPEQLTLCGILHPGAFTDLQKLGSVTDENKLKRLTIDLTAAEHRALKGLAAKEGMTMRRLVLKVLRQEGLLGRSKARRP